MGPLCWRLAGRPDNYSDADYADLVPPLSRGIDSRSLVEQLVDMPRQLWDFLSPKCGHVQRVGASHTSPGQ
jgi:hypothetical protein